MDTRDGKIGKELLQLLGMLRGRLELALALLAVLDLRTDNEHLMALFNLLSDEAVQPWPITLRYGEGVHLLASRRQFVEHRHAKIVENHQRVGARDRCRRHDKNMRVRTLVMQRAPLRNAKAMLFVRDSQRQITEFNILGEQRVCTYNNVAAPSGKRGLYRAFFFGFH